MRLLGYCGYGMFSVLFEKVSYGGRVLRNASAMTAEREFLRMGIEYLTVLFPTEVSSFDFQVESTDRTVQYKLDAQSLRLFGLHRDVNDAHRAGANRHQNKQKSHRQASCQTGTMHTTWGSHRSQDVEQECGIGPTSIRNVLSAKLTHDTLS